MKNLLFLLALCGTITTLSAQQVWNGRNWKLKRIGVAIGQDQDMLTDMSHDYFLDNLRDATNYDFSNINATERHTYSMLCENPHLRLNMSFQNQKHPEIEFGMNIVGIFNRIDEVVYTTPGSSPWSYGSESLRFTQYGNEIAIEPTLSYRRQRGAFALTGTIGTNAGYTFGNTLDIDGYNLTICDNAVTFRTDDGAHDNCETIEYLNEYEYQRNGVALRTFAQLDASFEIAKRLEMGMTVRRGLGVRINPDAPNTTTNLHSAGVFMRWVLR